jgi:hypothetical protein
MTKARQDRKDQADDEVRQDPHDVTYDLMREIGPTAVCGNPGAAEPITRNALDGVR